MTRIEGVGTIESYANENYPAAAEIEECGLNRALFYEINASVSEAPIRSTNCFRIPHEMWEAFEPGSRLARQLMTSHVSEAYEAWWFLIQVQQ